MRSIGQPLEPISLIPRQLLMDSPARRPEPRRHIRHRLAILDHGEHSLIPLL